MAIKFYSNSKALLAKLHEDLFNAFEWHSSHEGHEYWSDVAKKLAGYMREAERAGECKAEIEALKKRIAELEQRCP